MLETIITVLVTSLATGFASWVFYIRKHKADAVSAEKGNDRTEIDNLKLIVKEWRDAATQWKDMADDYQIRFIEQNRKMEQFFSDNANNIKELEENKKQIEKLKNLLTRANKRIKHLEDQLKAK